MHYVFKQCLNSREVIAYTDANHAINRSQSGAVIKLGDNVVTWRSMKQSEVSISSAESEVKALAMTSVLAEYVSTLRESLCLPTPVKGDKMRQHCSDRTSHRRRILAD